MKVLVTGATGFIGKNLILELESRGDIVRALVHGTIGLSFLKDHSVEIVEGDISNFNDVQKAVNGVDLVFNLAAALPHHNLPELEYWKTNADGMKNILQSCLKYKTKRLVHVSTVGIYDKSVTPYTKSKTEAERLINQYRTEHKLPVVIVRPTIAYGPFDTRPGFSNLFPLINKGMFIPIGKGDNSFHSVYVGNLVQALLEVSTNKDAVGKDFIIGDDPCPTMKEIVQTIAEVEDKKLPPFYLPLSLALVIGKCCDLLSLLGLPAPLPTRRVRFITDNRKYDLSEARKILNYQPKFSLHQGIEQTYLWYKDQGVFK